jgi:hypothetical protein
MANFAVVYDACLFYPAPLRDLMVRLAQTRRFRACWTERRLGHAKTGAWLFFRLCLLGALVQLASC